MKDFSPHETQVLRTLLRDNGVDPTGFQARVVAGSIEVDGPGATVCYPAEGWQHRFVEHLQRGLFPSQLHRDASPPRCV
jgi:hypothetical protein